MGADAANIRDQSAEGFPAWSFVEKTAAQYSSSKSAKAATATGEVAFPHTFGISVTPDAASRPSSSKALALTYVAIAATGVLFVGACGPVISPHAFNLEAGFVARLSNWSPIPQSLLLVLFVASVALASLLKRRSKEAPEALELPAGLTVRDDGVVCGSQGAPLPRGVRLAADGRTCVIGPERNPLPKSCILGPGGVLLHAASGRPVPHSCGISRYGELLSSTGETLPDSMSVGPNSTLLAADGTVLSPDLQPVPTGFGLSACGNFLMRPNGKPVPRGVHVGPGFRLLKPTGATLPDGVKIGPCGTIICMDGSILASDGHPTPAGFSLNAEKTVILDPSGSPIEDIYNMGPNGTLISQDGKLFVAVGRRSLSSRYTLGPLGNLLCAGVPVPAAAYFAADTDCLVLP